MLDWDNGELINIRKLVLNCCAFFYLVQHILHQIKAQQLYNDLGLYQLYKVLQKRVEFKDFSRLLNDFPELFKADFIFKDFSRKPSKFKYFSSLCEPCNNCRWNMGSLLGCLVQNNNQSGVEKDPFSVCQLVTNIKGQNSLLRTAMWNHYHLYKIIFWYVYVCVRKVSMELAPRL